MTEPRALDRLFAIRKRHSEAWARLFQQPVLLLLQDGQVSPAALQRWMTQAYFYLEGIMALQSVLLRKAPLSHRPVLALALRQVVEELDFLYGQGLDTSIPPHPSVQAYLDFLRSLEAKPYPYALTLLWAMQRGYLDALTSVSPVPGEVGRLLERWNKADHQAVMHDIAELAAQGLSSLNPAELDLDVERMISHQLAYWLMALEYAEG